MFKVRQMKTEKEDSHPDAQGALTFSKDKGWLVASYFDVLITTPITRKMAARSQTNKHCSSHAVDCHLELSM